MIDAHDILTIQTAILKNVPPSEQQTANAVMNVGLHFIQLFERVTVAFENIAIELKRVNEEP